jgi:hypothetical protein
MAIFAFNSMALVGMLAFVVHLQVRARHLHGQAQAWREQPPALFDHQNSVSVVGRVTEPQLYNNLQSQLLDSHANYLGDILRSLAQARPASEEEMMFKVELRGSANVQADLKRYMRLQHPNVAVPLRFDANEKTLYLERRPETELDLTKPSFASKTTQESVEAIRTHVRSCNLRCSSEVFGRDQSSNILLYCLKLEDVEKP